MEALMEIWRELTNSGLELIQTILIMILFLSFTFHTSDNDRHK